MTDIHSSKDANKDTSKEAKQGEKAASPPAAGNKK
jgi:hypothetical protein